MEYPTPARPWEIPATTAPPPVRVPAELAQLLFEEEQAYDTICRIYREHLGKTMIPQYDIDPVEGREQRKVRLHLDTNHAIFSNFTHHFRQTMEGQDYLLEVAKKKAARKAGQWLFDVLQRSGSVYNPALKPVHYSAPQVAAVPMQPFLNYYTKTEEQLHTLSQTVSLLLEENRRIARQNGVILEKLEEIKEAQSKSAFESLTDAAFSLSHGKK